MQGRRYTIKQLPPELRPRERLLSEGPEALASAELLVFSSARAARRIRRLRLLGRSSPRVATSLVCTGSLCKSENTKHVELGFSAVLGSGVSEVRFEQIALS
jgi:hypothetical protein